MEYIIRTMREDEYPLLREFLYEAIFQEAVDSPLSKTIINQPEISQYIRYFGTQKDDDCLCAEINEKVIGAVWVRCMEGYGTIDKHVPEMAIALFETYRGQGIGTCLIRHMLKRLKGKGYARVSLSVQRKNPAWHLYHRIGFDIISEQDEEYIMAYDFKENS